MHDGSMEITKGGLHGENEDFSKKFFTFLTLLTSIYSFVHFEFFKISLVC